MNSDYMPRSIDIVLKEALEASGAVLIEGAKWCGKTRTAKGKSVSSLLMQDPDNSASYIKMADTKPSLLLKGECSPTHRNRENLNASYETNELI